MVQLKDIINTMAHAFAYVVPPGYLTDGQFRSTNLVSLQKRLPQVGAGKHVVLFFSTYLCSFPSLLAESEVGAKSPRMDLRLSPKPGALIETTWS
jgi:hypothetical protein